MSAVEIDEVEIRAAGILLRGLLHVSAAARGGVIFAHGSGSGRRSPRNRLIASTLHQARMTTLLFDLLTEEEEKEDAFTARFRFDVPFLADRLVAVTDWFCRRSEPRLPVGYFGASTGSAAALTASIKRPDVVKAVVSRGGRPDLARPEILSQVAAPTLFIVGGKDTEVIELNRLAMDELTIPDKKLVSVPGAGHLFEEPGALETVAAHARNWFLVHFRKTKKKYALPL